MTHGNYHSSPSGWKILNSKLETIIADYNKQAEEEAKIVADRKKVIQACQDEEDDRKDQRGSSGHSRVIQTLIKLSNKIKSALESYDNIDCGFIHYVYFRINALILNNVVRSLISFYLCCNFIPDYATSSEPTSPAVNKCL